MALAALLQFAASRQDIRRSLTVLDWLKVIGVPEQSVRRQQSMLGRIDKTFRHRDTVADRTGPFAERNIPGLGPLRLSTGSAASEAFLALLDDGAQGYEPGVHHMLIEAGRRGELVVDIGAHVGYFTTLAAAAGARVIAFEMHPDLLLEIKRNLWANGLDRAHVINAAVGSADGLIFGVRFDPTPGLRVEDTQDAPPPDAIDKALYDLVPRLSLDTAFAREGLTPDLVKIDVEGYEFDVLKGAAALISKGRTRFLVEFHPNVVGDFGYKPEDILSVFPADWACTVLQDDGSERPVDPGGRDLMPDPTVENVKLLFKPPTPGV